MSPRNETECCLKHAERVLANCSNIDLRRAIRRPERRHLSRNPFTFILSSELFSIQNFCFLFFDLRTALMSNSKFCVLISANINIDRSELLLTASLIASNCSMSRLDDDQRSTSRDVLQDKGDTSDDECHGLGPSSERLVSTAPDGSRSTNPKTPDVVPMSIESLGKNTLELFG